MELPEGYDTLTAEEQEYFRILMSPALWAAALFGWNARDYQDPVLEAAPDTKQLVLRLGRRLGKTEMMCILILWYAFTQVNAGNNEQYDILIITPYEKQIDLIFDRLHELIDLSAEVKASVRRDVQHRLEFKNGTVIQGITAGSKSGTGAANTRGQRADVIVLDEVDYMGDDDITNILNIRNEAPERIRIIAASTPSGDRRKYYDWCTRASRDYMAETDENGIGFVKYNFTAKKGRDGNGWTHFYAPSIVNKELLKTNPDTGVTYLEDLREELTEMRFIQEVLAEFGESETGVFQKKHIDRAIEIGRMMNVMYQDRNFERKGPRILSIDWDKYGSSTNMVGMQLNQETGKLEPFVRKEIARGDFTFDNAVKSIIELNEKFNFDWVMCDAGYGEYQIETLRKYGLKHPESGLAHKVIRINFSEKISVFDPIEKKMIKKDIKPFMVNNTVMAFEREHIALNPTDRKMIKQLEDYHVKSIGTTGRPTYGRLEEHIVDCIMLCVHGFNLKYSDMLKVTFATKMHGIIRPTDEREDVNVVSREIKEEETKARFGTVTMSTVSAGSSSRGGRAGFKGRSTMPSRSRF